MSEKTPFPFSVGFPLSIRQQSDSLAICGANRGEGWPILCEVPKDGPDGEHDAASIVKACTALVDGHTALADTAALRERLARAESEVADYYWLLTHGEKAFSGLGYDEITPSRIHEKRLQHEAARALLPQPTGKKGNNT